MDNTSTSPPQNQVPPPDARRIDQVPNWLVIVLIVLLALALMGALLFFA